MKVDMKITAAVILALVLESATVFLWAGQVSARLGEMERRLAAVEPANERLARIEAQVADLHASLARIETRLEGRR